MTREINQIPAMTWNWLGMNSAKVEAPEGAVKSSPIKVEAGKDSDKVTELPFVFEDGNTEGTVEIAVEPEAEHIVLMDFSSGRPSGEAGRDVSEGEKGFAEVKTKVSLGRKARLTLVQVHRVGEEFRLVNRIDADVDEKADFHLMQVFIRGGEIYADVHSDLRARRSALHIDTGYLTVAKQLLDINYEAVHTGELSTSDITVNGVLCDEAEKRFRGTIDFRHGAVGAVGNEIENVLLMDPDVVNKTIPIILCEEEDVEGNHGATIGRMDEDTLYYMKSRGLDEDAIRTMMKPAYIDAVICRAPIELKENMERIQKEEGLGENS